MVTTKIHGGLGNQMLEYAMGRALAIRKNTELRVDPSSLFDITPRKNFTVRRYALDMVFNIEPKLNFSARIARAVKIPYFATVFNKYYPIFLAKLGYWKYIKEQGMAYDPELLEFEGDAYVNGYWRSDKYFKDQGDAIRKDFIFRHALTGEAAEVAHRISATKSVCLHVRRGDNLWNPSSQKTHIMVGMDYFDKAVALMKEKIGSDMKVFVFSDGIDWCRENMKFDVAHEFVGDEHAGVEAEGHLHLMSLAKHFILPESTFSWWAAWLSSNQDKVVIAPNEMFKDKTIETKDMIPGGWIRI